MSQWRDEFPAIAERDALVADSIKQVETWIESAKSLPASKSAELLAAVLRDENGLNFAVGFVDGVVRPESLRISARNLAALRKTVPALLPAWMRALIPVGALLAPIAPWPVVPIARGVLRRMVGHLIIDASDSNLDKALGRIKGKGFALNVNLLGEAVLGQHEADKRLEGSKRLLAHPSVDYVSMKVSAAIAPHNPWAFAQAVEHIVERLTPLFQQAAASNPPKFINLDMEEYKDLGLTIEVFKRIRGREDLHNLRAGIVLQAYLPDAPSRMHELQLWARERRARGGAPIKVRIVKGANLSMETVDAQLHDWPLAVVESKQAADANYKRVVNYALTAHHLTNIEVGIAGHNLFDIAFAHSLMQQRGPRSGVSFEMLLGMAEAQALTVANDVGQILLYTPVVAPTEFDVAIAYLIRRLEESANPENFMSAVFELAEQRKLFDREAARFAASVDDIEKHFADTNRVQDRTAPVSASLQTQFENSVDSDPAITANKKWAASLFDSNALTSIGVEGAKALWVTDATTLEARVATAKAAAKTWQQLPVASRAEYLRKVANALEANRGRLIQVMMAEAGKTIDQADPEVSEAVDFANYYAQQALNLAELDGAKHIADDLVLVTPPWNFPIAIPAGSTFAALAAGSAALLKPAPQVTRCGAMLAEILGSVLPAGVVTALQVAEDQLGRSLISHKSVDQLVLTGAFDTAKLFRDFNPALRLIGETSGKNAIIVTEYADLDLAARDVVASAFGHAGQKCSAASLVILVGSVARSQRFENQLLDATRGLVVDYATNPLAQMGPLIEKPAAKLQHGLTELDGKERWLIEPKQLDNTGRLWSPGIRANVKSGSTSHLTEYFGPVLSIMHARNLEEAIALQNATDYGLTAGLHSLDAREIELWSAKVQAGNLYINRGITGAIVQRQPFGGWKKSAVGATAKAGGPNYLFAFGRFESAALAHQSKRYPLSPNVEALLKTIEPLVGGNDFAALTRAAHDDAKQLIETFGQTTDVTGLSVEKNLFRYSPAACLIRIDESLSDFDRYRELLAAAATGANISIEQLHKGEEQLPGILEKQLRIEPETSALARLSAKGTNRIWAPQIDAASIPVEIAHYRNAAVESGRITLLKHFKEQAIAITNHRFGNPLKYTLNI
jgi:RHH-type proline utilization regulon transcriptional repressor/proline dehydrogenase/delta 1-pyrroline-5-carboxylate dehydrogenase